MKQIISVKNILYMKGETAVDQRVTIIAAIAGNGAIGRNNKLIYRLPRDMKRFKTLTTGNTVIMGRRTFESLPKGALPDRRNIVLTRHGVKENFRACDVYRSLQEALDHCPADEKIYIIGGASVYREAMPLAARLCLTLVKDTPENADTFFPEYAGEWIESRREDFPADDKHAFAYSFVDFTRRQ